jgi:hypothetical protein
MQHGTEVLCARSGLVVLRHSNRLHNAKTTKIMMTTLMSIRDASIRSNKQQTRVEQALKCTERR